MAKLTLSIEPDRIEKAKRYASKHHTSISKMVSDFINKITVEEHEDSFLTEIKKETVDPEIAGMRGILKGKVANDINILDAKYEYLRKKYDL